MKDSSLLGELAWFALSRHGRGGAREACSKAGVRIAELEKAAGAALMAMAIDVVREGGQLSASEPNSALGMLAEALGLDMRDPKNLIAFQREYMARFAPKGAKNG